MKAACSKLAVLGCLITSAGAFGLGPSSARDTAVVSPANSNPSRRGIVASAALAFLTTLGPSDPAQASSAAYHVTAKLKKEAQLREALPRQEIANGVTFQDVRIGRRNDDLQVQNGSLVKADVHIKDTSNNNMLSHATAQFTVGSGQLLPSLEEGLMGMRVAGARRIHVPADLVEQGRQAGQLPVMQRELSRWGEGRSSDALAFDVEILALR